MIIDADGVIPSVVEKGAFLKIAFQRKKR